MVLRPQPAIRQLGTILEESFFPEVSTCAVKVKVNVDLYSGDSPLSQSSAIAKVAIAM